MATEWFVERNGKSHGPFSSTQLKQLVGQGKLKASDLVRNGQEGKAISARNVNELFEDDKSRSEPVPPPLPVQSADVGPQDKQASSLADGWYCAIGGRRLGPVALSHLKTLVNKGKLQPDYLVWHKTLPDWQPARTFESLFPEEHVSRKDPSPAPLPTSKHGSVSDPHLAGSAVERLSHREIGAGLPHPQPHREVASISGVTLKKDQKRIWPQYAWFLGVLIALGLLGNVGDYFTKSGDHAKSVRKASPALAVEKANDGSKEANEEADRLIENMRARGSSTSTSEANIRKFEELLHTPKSR